MYSFNKLCQKNKQKTSEKKFLRLYDFSKKSKGKKIEAF